MKEYYQTALERLRTLGARFAEAHPQVAPLLSSQSADPDVERILEGTAFLCGLIEQRLDENFPEIVQSLLDLSAPELLRPMPSQSLVRFTPMPNVTGSQPVRAGTLLGSLPVGDVSCPYTVMRDMDVLPVHDAQTAIERTLPGEAVVRLTLRSPLSPAGWWPGRLQLYINDHFMRASQWHMLLLRHTESITVHAGSRSVSAPRGALRFSLPPASPFAERFPSLAGFTHVRDYFAFPEKCLFLSLEGITPPRSAENDVEIRFHLRGLKGELPTLIPDLLIPNTVPVMNIFRHAASPFVIPHTRQDYRLTPEGDMRRELEIFRVERVAGIRRGGASRVYAPYAAFEGKAADVYVLRRSVSPINQRLEYHIGLLYEDEADLPEHETLTADLLCFHHTLPHRLRAGDICVPTDDSPAMASFANIIKPTPPIPAPRDPDMLWLFLSHRNANMLPLASAETLRQWLRLYLPEHESHSASFMQNARRIEAIRSFTATPEETLFKGRPLRGQSLMLELDGSGFASAGEMHLFGLVLENTLAAYATINTYIRLHIRDCGTGDVIEWPPRLGNRTLL